MTFRDRAAIACVLLIIASAAGLGATFASPDDRRPEPAPQPKAPPEKNPPAPVIIVPTQDARPPQRSTPQVQPSAPPATTPPSNPSSTSPPTAPRPDPAGGGAAPPDNGPVRVVPSPDDGNGNGNGNGNGTPPISPVSGSRHPTTGEELYRIAANQVKVKDLVRFIAEATGKSVIPHMTTAGELQITIVSNRPTTKKEALDLIFQAFRINKIAVVETDRYILIDSLNDVTMLGPHPVLGPEVDVFGLNEDGQFVYKIFKIQNTKADSIAAKLNDNPPEGTSIAADANSNQIVFFGDLATAKRVQRLINVLDVPAYVDVQTKTFHLNWADASQVATYINDLFAARGTSSSGQANQPGGAARGAQPQRPGQPQQRPNPGGGGGSTELLGTSEQLLVTVIPALNSITVRAEPSVLHDIERLITTAWDVNPTAEGPIFRYYDLKYTDPLKVKDVLQALLESGGGGGASSRNRSGGGGGNRANAGIGGARGNFGVGGGGGGEASADVAVANVFRIEAYPDSNRLLVISKTPQNFEWLDKMIFDLDRPLKAGKPINVPLKHANAIEVAEILNALLAPSGANASITAPEQGLSGINFQTAGGGNAQSNSSGVTSQPSGSAGSSSGGSRAGGTSGNGQITFPWQGTRGAGDQEATDVSALVGKSRVVPNSNQNSLLVLAPPEIQDDLINIIHDLDMPGRQVMITAILAEVQLGDQWAYGLQFGPAGLAPPNQNNAIVITGGTTTSGGTTSAGPMYSGSREGDFIGDLTTSVLNFGVDATVILQALDQVTNTRILQQPRVFTSDNKEAIFFDGQDIPFQTQQTNSGVSGGTTAAFQQISVGIGLNVRPRITKERNVFMDIEVLLSNQNTTSPLGVGGNPVIDRRQTNTKVTVKNGQTIVISGIRKEQRNYKKTKVPFLGDVPILDLVFAFTDDTTSTTELVVFITPVVVDNPDENDKNFNQRDLERLKELAKPLNEKSDDLAKQAGISPPQDDPTHDYGREPLAPIKPGAGSGSMPPGEPGGEKSPMQPVEPPTPAPQPKPSQPVGGP